MKYALFDIDHTLSDAYWRDHMIGGEGGWDAYHQASERDDLIEEIALLVDMFENHKECETIGVTTRPEKWRTLTISWMMSKGINLHHLLMRPNDDFRPAGEVKVDEVRKFLGDDFRKKVLFMIDDNEKVIEKFAAEGITTLHINASRREK